MRLTLIPSNKFIGIDGEFYSNIAQDFSWIPSNVHALQWYDTWGDIEYNDGTPNERIEELGIYSQAESIHFNEKQRIKLEMENFELSRDYWVELRILRRDKLNETDWTQILDNSLTEEQRSEWKKYRQELRDLTKNIDDPKPLVLNENHYSWPKAPN